MMSACLYKEKQNKFYKEANEVKGLTAETHWLLAIFLIVTLEVSPLLILSNTLESLLPLI